MPRAMTVPHRPWRPAQYRRDRRGAPSSCGFRQRREALGERGKLGPTDAAEVAPATDAKILGPFEVRLVGEVVLGISEIGLHRAHGEADVLTDSLETACVPRMAGDLALAQVHFE